MINYIEKGEGLHIAIAEAGYFLGQNDKGEWVSSDDTAVQAIIDSYEPENPVPESISPRQARLVLLHIGALGQVDGLLQALPEPTRSAALIEWEYATHIDRNSQLVAQLTSSLNLTNEQVDDLFRLGISL